jgi:hypothetical protein
MCKGKKKSIVFFIVVYLCTQALTVSEQDFFDSILIFMNMAKRTILYI